MDFEIKHSAKLVLLVLALGGCGGGGESDTDNTATNTPQDSEQNTDNSDQNPPETGDDSGSAIADGTDDIGTIPDIGDGDTDVVTDDDPDAEPTIPSDGDGSTDNIANTRVEAWQSAFSIPPSSDLTNRDALIDTIFELNRYEFALELLDDISALANQIVSGDAGFTQINVAEGGYDVSYLCQDGGRVLMDTESVVGKAGSLKFESCDFDGVFVNGFSLTTILNSRPTAQNPNKSITANVQLTYTEDGLSRTLSGLLIQTETKFPEGSDVSSSLSGSYSEGVAGQGDRLFTVRYNLHPQVFGASVEGRDEDDIGMALLPSITVVPNDTSRRWDIYSTTRTYLRGQALDGHLDSGQITIEKDDQSGARLVMQMANGDPTSFDLFGFSSTTDVNSQVISWSDDRSFVLPRIFDPLQ